MSVDVLWGRQRVAGRLGGAADEDPGVSPAGDRGERIGVRAGDRASGRAELRVGPAVLEVLGQRHEPRSGRGGLVGQGGRPLDVGVHVGTGIELDEGDPKRHAGMVRGVDRAKRPLAGRVDGPS